MVLIPINVTELALTPLTCASLINEIFINLIYQKSQIPYSFTWLQSIVRQRRNCTDKNNQKVFSINVENYFEVASTAYDDLQSIMTNIQKEFLLHSNSIKEVMIIFGSTPTNPKEVFTITIPHIEETSPLCVKEIGNRNNQQRKVLREIFLTDDWSKAMQTQLGSTNTYVMIKKSNRTEDNSDFFSYQDNYEMPVRCPRCIIELVSESDKCVNNLDYSDKNNSLNEDAIWYQAKLKVKGFKDLFINKVSASKIW